MGRWDVSDLVTGRSRRGTSMRKTISCTTCKRRIKIEGPTDGSREVSQPVTCPFCATPNEVDWPMAAGYTVAPADGEEIPE